MDEDRTTALGFFHYAHSYAKAAAHLEEASLTGTHPHAPVRFLFAHAAELYLKAFLCRTGVPVAQLKSRDFGHSFGRLTAAANERGLRISKADMAALLMLDDAIFDRYIETGARSVLPAERMLSLCRLLHNRIGPPIYRDAKLSRALPSL